MQMQYYRKSILSILSDLGFLLGGYFLCVGTSFWNKFFSAVVLDFFVIVVMCLALCSLVTGLLDIFYLKQEYVSNSFKTIRFSKHTIKGLFNNRYKEVEEKDKYAFFLTIVKLIFIPLMIQFVYNNYMGLSNLLIKSDYSTHGGWIKFFNDYFYPLVLSLSFFIDTVFYLFGYLIYSDTLDNKIRSVETTFLGWMSALLCYPPLVAITGTVFPISGNDFPFWISQELTFVLRLLMLVLVIIYVTATVNLGWKCSNLTNRGIVSHGVYAFVRHPAYIAKNLFWWISLIPFFISHPFSIVYMLGLSGIYLMRALTEERHLSKDPDYVHYCKNVKYRFIPKIF